MIIEIPMPIILAWKFTNRKATITNRILFTISRNDNNGFSISLLKRNKTRKKETKPEMKNNKNSIYKFLIKLELFFLSKI